MCMPIEPMRNCHGAISQVDSFYVTGKEPRLAQQLAHWTNNIGQVQVTGGYLVQHGRKQEIVIAIDQGDLGVGIVLERLFQLQGGVQATKSTAQDQYVIFAHNLSFTPMR